MLKIVPKYEPLLCTCKTMMSLNSQVSENSPKDFCTRQNKMLEIVENEGHMYKNTLANNDRIFFFEIPAIFSCERENPK